MNQTVYKDQIKNAIRVSNFVRFDSDYPFSGLGVKYVVSGEETYYANNKKFSVRQGEYIIGNDFTKSVVQINHKHEVQGLCIDISSEIITEVAQYHDLSDANLKEFLLSDQFFVNRYNVKNTCLGYSLHEINKKIKAGLLNDSLQQCELFYSLAESIITDQRFVFDHLHKMEFKKTITNEEVFRAILQARTFIDEHAMDNLSLDQIALQIGISKYHFLRVFKNTFGISPYQYQKRIKLEKARIDLLYGRSIMETAFRYGYADVPSFSKAFKQAFLQSPGRIRISNF